MEAPWTLFFYVDTRMLTQRVTCRASLNTYFMMNRVQCRVALMRGAPELPDLKGNQFDTCSVRYCIDQLMWGRGPYRVLQRYL